MNSQPLWDWVNERHAVWWRRVGTMVECQQAGVPFRDLNDGFYTNDPIFQQYRFCNVFRELDRVTGWIRYNIRRRYADHPNLWLMLAIARTINWPDTLEFLMEYEGAWPNCEEFSLDSLTQALQERAAQRKKVYTGAYMIRAESDRNKYWYDWSKHRYIAEIVIGRLWEDREWWTACLNDSPDLEAVWSWFQRPHYIGWGPFMAYQVVVDMRHTHYLRDASDINTWAALGPGSRRGLNRLAGRDVHAQLSQKKGLEEMIQLYEEQDQFKAPWVPHIELSDIQNCLCETDKYLRVKNGDGRPRAKYVPGRGY